jgi:hypothetical protein
VTAKKLKSVVCFVYGLMCSAKFNAKVAFFMVMAAPHNAAAPPFDALLFLLSCKPKGFDLMLAESISNYYSVAIILGKICLPNISRYKKSANELLKN